MFKKQRFRHGAEAAKHARKHDHKVTVHERYKGTGQDGNYGRLVGWDIDDRDGDSIHVKNQELGPASNMYIVVFFSCAGILAAICGFISLLGG
ncbi:MAG: hypothetical protein GWO10_16330 [candidate division Zixibacteria bacterium]|nr:hypothetical protein [Gammaproteobacteria bacterium]NIR25700.1 hypothetical protein [Gammaproteobacteria bacterium]NIR65293.1 hypothetical protein [candidate division Zixibacteria bacterium]NIS52337.1 hypothetical protein [Phycisphaerae bacterium]NIX02136.1 hypothetical protein [Phycisphaerae bacterium]